MEYLEETITGRTHAKDIRIFGLRPWLDQVWNDAFRLYQGFLARRERAYLWATAADLVLALLRNGVAYGYLIALTLRQGLSASQFLLYFTAVSGFHPVDHRHSPAGLHAAKGKPGAFHPAGIPPVARALPVRGRPAAAPAPGPL